MTAPERPDLRERIAEELHAMSVCEAGDPAGCDGRCRNAAERVLAVLSEDTGDLRERIAGALTREHYRRARERIEASPEEHCAAFADVVLPIFAAETVRLTIRITGLEEANAELLARLERQTEQVDDLAEETAARTGEVEQLASRYEAQVAALREELAGVGVQGERDLEEATRQRERAEQAEAERDAANNLANVREKLLREAWDAHHATMDRLDAANATITRVREELAEAKAVIERVRRGAQVWADIRPTRPTVSDYGHGVAWAGETILAALDASGGTESTEETNDEA